MISVLAGPSHSLTTLGSSKWSGQVSALRRFPSASGAPVGKALPGRYALRNGRKLMAKLNINGKMRDVRVEADTPLLWVIREHVGLTGTKYGCGVALCDTAAVFRAGQTDMLPDNPQERRVRLDPHIAHLPIDIEFCHELPPIPQSIAAGQSLAYGGS